jgi:hypothetical protein
MICRIDACESAVYCRSLCLKHYRQGLRGELTGTAERAYSPRVIGPVDERLWAKVEGDDYIGCWNWTGSVNEKGYGRLSVNGKPRRAHRLAYEHMIGEIPQGLELDHLCKNRRCVNPWHLEPVTHLVNVARIERVS